jgi:hypothetical protein
MQAFNGWFKENDHLVTVLDTSHITVAETAESAKAWLADHQIS